MPDMRRPDRQRPRPPHLLLRSVSPHLQSRWMRLPTRGATDICSSHRQQLRTTGKLTPRRQWAKDWVCVVCGAEVDKGSGRRKHCSNNCQVLDSRWKGSRPDSLECQLCGQSFSMLAFSGTKRQRSDTKWCQDCGRNSPAVKRFVIYGVTTSGRKSRSPHGFLCGSCNRALGLLRDDPGNFRRAIEYLDRAKRLKDN